MPRHIALRTFLISALPVVLLPIVMTSGWFYYRSAQSGTEPFALEKSAKPPTDAPPRH